MKALKTPLFVRTKQTTLFVSLLGLVLGIARPAVWAGSSPATITLASSANPSILGQALRLTATVTPSSATGKIAFYDGVYLLDSVPLAAGQATITTIQLPSGHHQLHARYGGDANYAGAVSGDLSQTVLVHQSNGFMTPTILPTAAMPTGWIATGDFDGDGNLDIVGLGSASVSVAPGNGDGTFKSSVETSLPSACTGGSQMLGVGDFNNDGKLDVVVTLTNYVCFLLGNGDGTLQAPIVVPIALTGIHLSSNPSYTPFAFVVGDFNLDGNADIAVISADLINSEATVTGVLGNGDGSFQGYRTLVDVGPSGPFPPMFVASSDFNGDGIPDFAVSYPCCEPSLNIYLGNGDGSFQSGASYASEGGVPVVADDFNGDGKLDLAVLDLSGSSVRVLLGNGDGTFQDPVTYPVNPGTSWIASGDFNGDGIADLLGVSTNNPAGVNDGMTGSYGVLFGKGDGTFQPEFEYPRPYSGIRNIVTGDFNHDGVTDFVVSTGDGTEGVQVVLGKPALPFSLTTPTPGTKLSGSTAVFAWSNPGNLAPRFVLRLGTTGLGSSDVLSGAATTGTSQQVSAIPTNGAYLYARLWYYLNGTWRFADARYIEAGTPAPPVFVIPAPGSTLPGSTVTFGWNPGVGATRFLLRLGTTGLGSADVASGAATTATSVQVAPIPTHGAKLYARLWYYLNEKWQFVDAIYTETSK